MARIAGVSARKTSLAAKLTYSFTRRRLMQLTGREPGHMTEPLELYAHTPGLLFGYGMLEWASSGLDRVEKRLKFLAVLKAATLTQCEYCIDMGSQIARQAGLSDEQMKKMEEIRKQGGSREEMRAVLTPQQQAKFDALRSQRKGPGQLPQE